MKSPLASLIPNHPESCAGVSGFPFTGHGNQCRLCWLATYDQRYRELWKIAGQEADSHLLAGPWAVAVTTAPRAVPRLLETLDSLRLAGWSPSETVVFAEPEADVPAGWTVDRATTPQGGWGNWKRALETTLRDRPDARTIFLLQDDVRLLPDLRTLCESWKFPATMGMFSPYCPAAYSPADGAPAGPFRVVPKSFRKLPKFGMIGACTLMFPRPAAEALAAHPFVRSYQETRWIDGVVGYITHATGRTTHFHSPSLALHTGDTSTLHGQARASGIRQAADFPDGLSAIQLLPRRTRREPKIGVIGWLTASGLGRLTYAACSHLPVLRWLAPRHQRFPFMAAHPDVDMWYCQSTRNLDKLRQFLTGLDLVLVFELPYFARIAEIARSVGCKTAAVMMHECSPPACRGWPQEFDLLIMPNETCRRELAPALPRGNYRTLRWPIDTNEIPFRQRTRADTFFFGQGTGGGSDRKGGNIVMSAARLTPDIHWAVRSQIVDPRMRIFEVEYNFPANVTVKGQVEDPAQLYDEGDVAVQPSRYEGLGLQLLEAQAAGLPLITTDAGPMNEYNPWRVVPATPRPTSVVRPTTAWDTTGEDVARVVRDVQGSDISSASSAAREWVEREHSWAARGDEIMKLFTETCFP